MASDQRGGVLRVTQEVVLDHLSEPLVGWLPKVCNPIRKVSAEMQPFAAATNLESRAQIPAGPPCFLGNGYFEIESSRWTRSGRQKTPSNHLAGVDTYFESHL